MNSKFICIKPKSKTSEIIFEEDLRKLHTCKVLQQKENKMMVKSIAGDYYFWIDKTNDNHWTIIH